MENEEQNPETLQEEQTEETITQAPEETPELSTEERLKALEEAKAKAEQEANKYRRLLAKQKKLSTSPKDEDEADEPSIKEVVSRLELSDKKRQFGYEHNLSPVEVDMVFRFSGNNPTKETLNDDFVKGGLEKLRAKQRVANNTPASTPRSKPFETKEWSEMSPEEKNKNFSKYVQSFKKR